MRQVSGGVMMMELGQGRPGVFTTEFQRRDFSGPILVEGKIRPMYLRWSAWGGSEKAELVIEGGEEELLGLTELLRCGVIVRDEQAEPVWWGYVSEVEVRLAGVTVRVAIADLANRVRVQYAFLSPDSMPGQLLTTPPAEDAGSQREFGVKERVLLRQDLDDAFAEQLRDTHLAQSAWPVSSLEQRAEPGRVQAVIHCRGWFDTLDWQVYENQEGFYATSGLGPGSFAFGNSNASKYAGQSFNPGTASSLKYVYFLLRNVGGATRPLTARLHLNGPWYPGAVLATSQPFDPSGLPSTAYAWARFTFATPYALSGDVRYWITLDPNGVNSLAYFMLRLDGNMSYLNGDGRYYNQTTDLWNLYPPADRPDAHFRCVCVTDTGTQLAAIAAVAGGFFPRITTLPTGIETSPFRKRGLTCLDEVQRLMRLGTVRQRWVLAQVTPERHLCFFEQPDSADEDVYLDPQGRCLTRQGVVLPAWHPPVGRFFRLAGSNRVNLPWDRRRLPASFVAGAEYWPETGRVALGMGGD